ncbi:MAG: YitT family protein [Clostridia bacterium]|nr:YitT family protein [Clostridia bacterium]
MPTKEQLRDWMLMTAGTIIMVIGIYFFKYTNNFSTGGVSGISVILAHYIQGMTPGTVGLVINVALLILGYAVLGRSFGVKTTYVTLLQSGLLRLLEIILPMKAPMTSQPLLELIFAVSLPAIGSAILFNVDASSGGTDIIAMIMRKYSTLDIGRALLLSDCVITFSACIAFGMTTGLFSILGLVMKSLLVDMVLENLNINKCFHIITSHPDSIERYIIHNLHRGATRLHGEGIFSHEGKEIILTVVNRKQGVLLRRYVKSTDPSAFLLINNTSEIIGNGFRGVN